jgi:hypothetical protein
MEPVNGTSDVPVKPAFSWESLEDATGYQFQLATDTSFQNVIIDKIGSDFLSSNSYTSEIELAYATTYFWRVMPVSDIFVAEWSTTYNFKTESNPTNSATKSTIEPENGAYDLTIRPSFSWEVNEAATGYEFQLATDPEFTNLLWDLTGVAALTRNNYTLNHELFYFTTYFWRTRAVLSTSVAEWSTIRAFTTQPEPTDNTMALTLEPLYVTPVITVPEANSPILTIPETPVPAISIASPAVEPFYLSSWVIWSIIVLVVLFIIMVFYLGLIRRRRLAQESEYSEYREQLDRWESQGYDVSRFRNKWFKQ